MTTFLFIAIPCFIILAGAIGALSLSSPPVEELEEARAAEARPQEAAAAPLVFVPASAMFPEARTMPVDELLAEIEAHLREERQAASAFAADPSSESLWMN